MLDTVFTVWTLVPGLEQPSSLWHTNPSRLGLPAC